jgi:hypothetical protein
MTPWERRIWRAIEALAIARGREAAWRERTLAVWEARFCQIEIDDLKLQARLARLQARCAREEQGAAAEGAARDEIATLRQQRQEIERALAQANNKIQLLRDQQVA